MTNEKKNSAGKGCVVAIILITVGFFGLAILGILAAIAIPSFLKYTKKSKVVESKVLVQKIENSVKMFYAKECKFPNNGTTSKLPLSGKKIIPRSNDGGFKQIGMFFSESVYFRYRLVNEDKKLRIIADADFNEANTGAHTHTIVLTAGPNCSVLSSPARTTNELQ